MSNSTSSVTTVDQGGAPPLPHRRPRVREVSSRFMSPAPSSSSSTPDLHSVTAKSPINRPKHSPAPDRSLKLSPSPSQRHLLLVRSHEHENHSSSSENIPQTVRSMDFIKNDISTRRKPRVKLFKENESSNNNQIPKSTVLRTNKSTRSDTPALGATCDRIVPSRFMLPHRQTQTDAAKLLRLSGLSFSSAASTNDTVVSQTESTHGGSCPNSPISSQQNQTWPLPDTRSSITDDNTLSARLFIRTSNANCLTSSKFYTPSLCSRSLNFPPSQNSFKSSSDRSVCKPPIAASIGVEKENRNLPPQPGGNKAGVDLRKGKKAQCSQEEAHSLKMLHNHYLLWRYANAKAQASIEVQRTEIEKHFFSVGTEIAHLRDTVKKKQAELAVLQRIQALSTIVEAQMPYLDEWSALEEDYTHSLSGATKALTNSLLRLPVSGNVQVNIKEAAEALDSAVKTTDMIVNHMQSFLPKAEEMDTLISELANINDAEKALVEECGNLLAKTNTLQVGDCSLRGHLMQLHCS